MLARAAMGSLEGPDQTLRVKRFLEKGTRWMALPPHKDTRWEGMETILEQNNRG